MNYHGLPVQTDIFDAIAAASARDAGIERVANHSTDWQDYARRAIERLAQSKREFTSDDLYRELDGVRPHHPNAVGAAFRLAVVDQLIRCVGFRNSERVAAKARRVAVYVGA